MQLWRTIKTVEDMSKLLVSNPDPLVFHPQNNLRRWLFFQAYAYLNVSSPGGIFHRIGYQVGQSLRQTMGITLDRTPLALDLFIYDQVQLMVVRGHRLRFDDAGEQGNQVLWGTMQDKLIPVQRGEIQHLIDHKRHLL